MGCQNECLCIYIEPCIWSYPVDRNSSCLVNLLYIWLLLAAEVLFSSWLLGSNAYSLLSLLIKTPQRCFIANCLMVSVKVDIFGISHFKQNVFSHIVCIKRQCCLKHFISVWLVANYFLYYFKNVKNVLTSHVDLYFSWFWSEKRHVWEKVIYHRLTEGGANVINCVKTTEEEEQGDKSGNGSRGCLHHPPTEPGSDRAEPKKNGVHFRGLLLHAGSAAHSGAYFLCYLARKYTPRRHEWWRLPRCWEVTDNSELKGEGGWFLNWAKARPG